MKIELLDLAQGDLIEGYYFYEAQEAGLGSYFLDTLYSDIDSLRIFGGIHRKAYKDFHRALSKRFPFAIYYTMDAGVVRVRSVVDCRKNPSWIRKHLGTA
ncbi:MAG: type II toxin-antitoxin system RelE/ParE family toxin [Verrucomicrobiaceae bacterium]|nr:MAG: type II toxin-antitoxin system RelE/ParE family toxin [Verrucomicrobiaceae bacterium]